MNSCFNNLSKIEFVVTYACTGRCKHCSEGDHSSRGVSIDPRAASRAVREISASYGIKTVMAFGGEPLLYPDAVYAIMNAASEMGVPKRQVITNGYFTRDESKMREVAKGLAGCGVNDLLLSVDAFHQETIPLDAVMQFAAVACEEGIPMRLQPAWLVSADDDNPYNVKTREVLTAFRDTGIPVSEGNVVFPEGNALKYLSEYFKDGAPENPYIEDPCDVRCVSVEPDGGVFGDSILRRGIIDIMRDYSPGV